MTDGDINGRSGLFYNDRRDVDNNQKILKQMKVSHLEGLGLKDYPVAVMASGSLLQYLLDLQ